MSPQILEDVWLAARLRQPLLGFQAGDTVYIRRYRTSRPLAVGPVNILFSPKQDRSVRVAHDSVGLNELLHLIPSNVNPVHPSQERNDRIEEQYQEWLKRNPPMPRFKAASVNSLQTAADPRAVKGITALRKQSGAQLTKKSEEDSRKTRKRYEPPPMVTCASCGEKFQDTDLGMLSRAMQNHLPACSYRCNRKLGQVR